MVDLRNCTFVSHVVDFIKHNPSYFSHYLHKWGTKEVAVTKFQVQCTAEPQFYDCRSNYIPNWTINILCPGKSYLQIQSLFTTIFRFKNMILLSPGYHIIKSRFHCRLHELQFVYLSIIHNPYKS